MSATTSFPIGSVIRMLEKEYAKHCLPVAEQLNHDTRDPYKVLTATILSARTKDETTAEAARRLFAAAPTMTALSRLTIARIRRLIYPVGFYRTKAAHLKRLPAQLQALFGGAIPHTVEELIRLPGVGRKTANLVVAVAFDKPAICVDVHVHRISNRWGYVSTSTPLETEMVLRATLPRTRWKRYNSLLVSFGQHTCRPVNPRCGACPLVRVCGRIGLPALSSMKEKK
jgi:endonuclease III